jgi:hypothetical protein
MEGLWGHGAEVETRERQAKEMQTGEAHDGDERVAQGASIMKQCSEMIREVTTVLHWQRQRRRGRGVDMLSEVIEGQLEQEAATPWPSLRGTQSLKDKELRRVERQREQLKREIRR